MSIFRGLLAGSAALLLAGAAFAQTPSTRLTHGDAVLDVGATAPPANLAMTSSTSSATTSNGNFRISNGTAGSDNTFSMWWFYRVSGDTRERAFHAPTTGGAFPRTVTGTNQVEYGFANMTSTGTNVVAGLSAKMKWILTDVDGGATAAGTANIQTVLELTNASPAPITVDLFYHWDVFLGNEDASDSVSVVDTLGGLGRSRNIRDVSTDTQGSWYGQFRGYGARGSAAGAFATVNGQLGDTSVDNFGPSETPGESGSNAAADNALLMQWRYTIPAGTTFTAIGAACATNFVTAASNVEPNTFCTATPEPASFALLALGGLLFARRR